MIVEGDFVLEASCALVLVLKESQHSLVRAAMTEAAGHRCMVPDFFDAECASGIARAVRRGRLRGDMWARAWAGIASLDLERHPSHLLGLAALRIALERSVSTYDALYVALSAEEGVPLVTADAKLARALLDGDYNVVLLGESVSV